MTNQELSISFFLMLAVILIFIRIVGYIGAKLGQSQVVCEMIAGVLIGPSFFGWLFPGIHSVIFPKQALSVVYCVSQVGLALYMFLIGTEFNVQALKGKFHKALKISAAGILTPFILGGAFAFFVCKDPILFSPSITPFEAIAFTGSAMSITAFPMLARILYERGLSGTPVGTLLLSAGSIDDATAWCLLAVVTASFSGNFVTSLSTMIGGLLYVFIMLFICKPMFKKIEARINKGEQTNAPLFSIVLSLVMIGAFLTDYIGIYAVFGAFIMGISMPRGNLQKELVKKIEPITTSFLLPLFFVYSGLNTQFSLVLTPQLIVLTIVILILACLGKGVACWATARLSKINNTESLMIGVLMNARGLMELILINIGLEKGIITKTYFTIMMIMALISTVMVAPIWTLIFGKRKSAADRLNECAEITNL